jgi:quinol monooxygenase YgiN
MIIRIVKLSFKENKIDDFLDLFRETEIKIRNFTGCKGLSLLRDINNSHIFFTYSMWENESDLNKYRDSLLFKSVWQKTRLLFSSPAEAWSLGDVVCN